MYSDICSSSAVRRHFSEKEMEAMRVTGHELATRHWPQIRAALHDGMRGEELDHIPPDNEVLARLCDSVAERILTLAVALAESPDPRLPSTDVIDDAVRTIDGCLMQAVRPRRTASEVLADVLVDDAMDTYLHASSRIWDQAYECLCDDLARAEATEPWSPLRHATTKHDELQHRLDEVYFALEPWTQDALSPNYRQACVDLEYICNLRGHPSPRVSLFRDGGDGTASMMPRRDARNMHSRSYEDLLEEAQTNLLPDTRPSRRTGA